MSTDFASVATDAAAGALRGAAMAGAAIAIKAAPDSASILAFMRVPGRRENRRCCVWLRLWKGVGKLRPSRAIEAFDIALELAGIEPHRLQPMLHEPRRLVGIMR